MKITLLVDNEKSWIVPFVQELESELQQSGYDCKLVHGISEVPEGELLFLLGCEKIVDAEILKKNKHNLVIHESALPHGKGWSPLTWQILEGKNEIPVSLFEADEKVDNGPIYLQETLRFQGNELNPELKESQGRITQELVKKFIQNYPHNITPHIQSGEETFYPKRTPQDSKLDPDKTVAEQFDLLRVVDNERYPAWFEHKGRKYILKIFPAEE